MVMRRRIDGSYLLQTLGLNPFYTLRKVQVVTIANYKAVSLDSLS